MGTAMTFTVEQRIEKACSLARRIAKKHRQDEDKAEVYVLSAMAKNTSAGSALAVLNKVCRAGDLPSYDKLLQEYKDRGQRPRKTIMQRLSSFLGVSNGR